MKKSYQLIWITMTFVLVIMIPVSPVYALDDMNITTSTSINDNKSYVGEINRERSNPEFVFIDNQSGIVGSRLPSYWNDSRGSCNDDFECINNFTTGWQDNSSLQVSTTVTTEDTWSWIYGNEIEVNPNERYELVTHMKYNDLANSSHIAIETYNETLKDWNQIKQCPPGTKESLQLEWHQFGCQIIIPDTISKIRPILNAGWSSDANERAVTFFDDINLIRLTDVNFTSNVPTINDPNLRAEVVVEGLKLPTSMAFLGPDDILVLEKNEGTVRRVINGTMLPKPLLNVNVGSEGERGMLGIAIDTKNENGNKSFPSSLHTSNATSVFLYFTTTAVEQLTSNLTQARDAVATGNSTLAIVQLIGIIDEISDILKTKTSDSDGAKTTIPLSSHLYRYELENNTLVNPKLLLELPLTSKTMHYGGVLSIGPDNNVYTVVGDLFGEEEYSRTKAQNYKDGPDPDGRGGILRITQDGQVVNGTGILGDEHPLDKYYAYGIRNSFGLDFDPVMGKLWDTENGPGFGDEINLVEPGFNSGWQEIVGTQNSSRIGESALVADNLVDFGGKGKYSDPEYEWSEIVAPTSVKFLDSYKLGKEYANDMFVGDFLNGNIYHFELNKERTKLILDSTLEGRTDEKIIFARGFGGITDIEVGPDGYLYVVSFDQGKIFRIVPQNTN
jgi:aldose sugar dehydrogenase